MRAIQIAVLSAGMIAIVSAIFGAAMARLFWAEDLHHAIRIDKIRSETEGHLREQIKALEETLQIRNGGKP